MRRSVVVAVVGGLLLGALAPGTSSAQLRAPTTSGLVLAYQFNSDTGTTARDTGPKAIHGTYVNTTAAAAASTSLAGKGKAAKLVGAQHQYVAVPERNALDVNKFTLSAWVKYTGVQNDRTYDRWEVLEKADAYWINIRTNGKVRVGGFFGSCTSSSAWKYLDSTTALPRNTWTHVASTYNGSTLTVWINGKKAGSRSVTGTTCNNNNPLAVGAKNYPAKGLLEAFFDGQIDEVRIYNRALSASEIAGLMT
ncbi:MAG: LamG domain-containing protein [Ilumatobacteraceae bacterium]